MRKYIIVLILIISITCLFADKYAGEIFRIGAGVRSFALGGTGLTDVNSNSPAYWNAALLDKIDDTRFELLHAEEYQGLLNYDTFSAVWGNDTKISIVLTRIGINDIPLTKLEDPDQLPSYNNRPYEYKSVNNSDIVLYAGFSRKIGQYIIGFTPKLAYRNLADESGFGFGADISTIIDINDNLLAAIKVRDFFSTQILWSNGTHEIVNPGLDLEARYSFIFPILKKQADLIVGAECYTESRDTAATTSMGFFSADYHLGLDLLLHNNLDFFLGYDVDNLTSGLSVYYKNWNLNYGFEYNNELENSHRLSIGYRL